MKKKVFTFTLILLCFVANAGFYAHHDDRVSHPVVINPDFTTIEVSCEDGSTVTVIVMPGQLIDMAELEATYCPLVVDPI